MTTTTTDHTATRSGVTMKGRALALAAGTLLLAACNADKLTVPNRNSPIPGNIDVPTSVNLQVSGILYQARANHLSRVQDFMIFGREGFYYFPTDNRYTTGYLEPSAGGGLNNASAFGRGSGLWSGGYRQRRNIHTLLRTIEGAATISDAQKAGIRGFANTMAALEMHYLLQSRDSLGAVIEIFDDVTLIAPFVGRDSAYRWISGTLDAAAADLQTAGSTPFSFAGSLHAGLAGFNTPATFLEFNRAIAARVFAYRASIGECAGCYDEALDALDASFLDDAPSAAAMNEGVYHVFSATAGDQTNSMSRDANADNVAHPSITTDAERKADDTPDNRYAAKIVTIPMRQPAGSDPASIGISTTIGFFVYPTKTTNMPIVRGEELLLLRAEARWFTGDKAGAIADIDWIRVNVGGLPASALTTASSDADFVTELLEQRRMSLLLEGHRWPDHRRFGRLDALPLDLDVHFVARVQPIPSEECDIRVGRGAELAGPGCPNN